MTCILVADGQPTKKHGLRLLSSQGGNLFSYTQFSGYPPDIPVILSPADKTSNRDTPLEFAIRYLLAKRKIFSAEK
jgi:hypothetical protein